MQREDLIREKLEIIEDIGELREELVDYNAKLEDIGSSVSFINLILVPLLVAIIVTLVLSLIINDPSREIGSFILVFIVSLIPSIISNRKIVARRKEELKVLRLEVQKLIVSKSKRLSEIDKMLDK